MKFDEFDEFNDFDEYVSDIDTNMYDKCIRVTNCTIEILENTETGDISVGWYRSSESEEYEV